MSHLSLKVPLFELVAISLLWLSEATVEFKHRKTELSEQGGDDGSETNLKRLKQQRIWVWRVYRAMSSDAGRVSVSLSGACVH